MRLVSKIASSVLLGIILLLAIDGYLSVDREIDLFDGDMARDGILLGQTLKPLVADAYEHGGSNAVWDIIRQANRQDNDVEVRWVRLGGTPGGDASPRVTPARLSELTPEHPVSLKDEKAGYRYTYVVVPVTGASWALELSEPLYDLNRYTRNTIIRRVFLAATMILVSWLLLWAMGVRFVGGPLERLVEKTRRVGAGDFSGDVVVQGHDELSHLADAMNDMCAQLDVARKALRKETEGRMDALEQLRHAERLAMLGRLSSGIAHELGTPLNVVAGRANLIATEDLSHEEVVAYSNTIVEQARRMTEIIRQLLGFARRRPSQRETVDLSQLAGQILDLLKPAARKGTVSLELRTADSVPDVNVDRAHIQQVLMNLVMNGIHAMTNGGTLIVDIAVEQTRHPVINTGPQRDYVRIRVTDEGEGIPAENLKSIFEPFYTTKESGKGTGLGLSIAYGIVEEHDGWIDVESTPGEGSRFTVYLPIEVQS